MEDGGGGNAFSTTRVPGDNQVHFWIVGKDGRACRGEYTPGWGVTEIAH